MSQNWGSQATTLIRGYPRGPKMVPLDSMGMISY